MERHEKQLSRGDHERCYLWNLSEDPFAIKGSNDGHDSSSRRKTVVGRDTYRPFHQVTKAWRSLPLPVRREGGGQGFQARALQYLSFKWPRGESGEASPEESQACLFRAWMVRMWGVGSSSKTGLFFQLDRR